jgi:hypothetical protein
VSLGSFKKPLAYVYYYYYYYYHHHHHKQKILGYEKARHELTQMALMVLLVAADLQFKI